MDPNLRAFVDSMPDAILLHRAGKFVHVNQAVIALLGYQRPEQLLGRPLLDTVHPDDADFVRGRIESSPYRRAGVASREHRIVRPDGQAIPVEAIAVPVMHEGQLTTLVVLHDLTEKKRVEAQLVTADRMASLGRLSAAVGHEINNPLTFVLGALEVLQNEVNATAETLPRERADRLRELVGTVRQGAERVRDIVRNMKALSRGEAEECGPVDLIRVLDLCAAMANHEVRHRARLVKRYASVPPVYGNEGWLGQVFLNLLVNAADAIAEGDAENNEVTIVTLAPGDGTVVAEIKDTGAGIPKAISDRIFEPFFTTKIGGTGTGLGLAISHHIVTSLGGTIALVKAEERGSCFRVTLRECAPKPATEPSREGHPRSARRAARLLVVDDEVSLAKTVALLLDAHDVVTAYSAHDAMAALSHSPPFDLVLCDLHMNGLSGMDLFDRARRQFPDLEHRFLFMTGGAITERAREFVAAGRHRVLEKPFDAAALLAAVEGALAT
jgi:two-component system cell cycle sensor histidine kinase/response regulator CckA